MHNHPGIQCNNLTYRIPNTLVNFDNETLSFEQIKYGIVGDNGIGKTTLFRLITGELKLHSGSVLLNATACYTPQHPHVEQSTTISQVMGIYEKLEALKKIQAGDTDYSNYEIIGDDWDLYEKYQNTLLELGLKPPEPNILFHNLSGGQQTKVFLAKAMLSNADFLLLDEPTNNLDQQTRSHLYQFLNTTNKGVLIISHDRELLDLMDCIIEITALGINQYGGNYSHYVEQKKLHTDALERKVEHAQRALKKTKKGIQIKHEKHEQRKSKGRKAFRSGNMDKPTAKAKRGRSEKTDSRLLTENERLSSHAQEEIKIAKSQLEIKQDITISLSATCVPNNKTVLMVDNLSFSYPKQHKIIDSMNFKLIGPEHIALVGPNGSGKSTFVKLICGMLQPDTGQIKLGIETVRYLDQHVEFLDKNLSLIENFQMCNDTLSITDCYFALASFGFRNIAAKKIVKDLSGGEKIRAGIVCSFMAAKPPQLIILDEPTNHLDIRSIQSIEATLINYEGAMIVISHDTKFLDNISISRYVNFEDQEN